MELLITILLTFLLLAAVMWLLTRVRTPRYRLERANVEKLLELVLAGRAREQDWSVFTGIPIRHDPQLEAVRQACVDLERREWRGGRWLLSEAGRRELEQLLTRLRE